MKNWNKLLGYVGAFGIIGMAGGDAWALCFECPHPHSCSGNGVGIHTDVCGGRADIMAGFVSGAWQVGISIDSIGTECTNDGGIQGTLNSVPIAGCGATDQADDGQSATDTTGCTNVNGSIWGVNYCTST